MTRVIDLVPRDRFLPLPRLRTEGGAIRRTGVEIELAGLSETEAADLVVRRFGGTVQPAGPFEVVVERSALGEVQIYLDTRLRKDGAEGLARLGLDRIGREVIPLEIVTEPLASDRLDMLTALAGDLRAAGAVGSGGGVLFGFGVHFNIEDTACRVETIRPVLTAFALLEDWLRLAYPIDGARRVLPFVDPYPRRFVRALLDLPPEADLAALIDLYLAHTPSRNRGLDMLPLFRHVDAARVARALPPEARGGARPAYHFRLADSRVDEPDWTLAFEWNRWVLVERVADDADLLAHLAEGWRTHQRGGDAGRHGWCARVDAVLAASTVLGDGV